MYDIEKYYGLYRKEKPAECGYSVEGWQRLTVSKVLVKRSSLFSYPPKNQQA